mmetsp:Transcript_113867/g.197892  ORF Transcript_113867/g.197892 Transcript_113867/m.197892 type:complete len:272 (-) Transcript_113867:169-984(-)
MGGQHLESWIEHNLGQLGLPGPKGRHALVNEELAERRHCICRLLWVIFGSWRGSLLWRGWNVLLHGIEGPILRRPQGLPITLLRHGPRRAVGPRVVVESLALLRGDQPPGGAAHLLPARHLRLCPLLDHRFLPCADLRLGVVPKRDPPRILVLLPSILGFFIFALILLLLLLLWFIISTLTALLLLFLAPYCTCSWVGLKCSRLGTRLHHWESIPLRECWHPRWQLHPRRHRHLGGHRHTWGWTHAWWGHTRWGHSGGRHHSPWGGHARWE